MKLWEEINEQMSSFGYMTEIDRSKQRIAATAEIFTPTELVIEILQKISLDEFSPGKLVLDPACGDGQFLLAAKLIKILHFKMQEEDALSEIYGVDIMRDNVDLCKKRLGGGNIFLGNSLNPSAQIEGQTDHEHAKMIEIFGRDLSLSKTLKGKPPRVDSENDLWIDFRD